MYNFTSHNSVGMFFRFDMKYDNHCEGTKMYPLHYWCDVLCHTVTVSLACHNNSDGCYCTSKSSAGLNDLLNKKFVFNENPY